MKKAHAMTGVVSLTALALIAAGCGNNKANTASSKKQQTITWSETSAITTSDVSQATDTVSFQTLMNTQEGVYRLADSGKKTELALAKKVDVSKDGKTYNVTLRDAKWSNGDPITAQDFVYSWRRTVDPKTKSQDAFYFAPVANANDIIAGKKPTSALGIKAKDSHHFTITLAQPTAYFKQLLAWPLFYPLDQKVVEKYGKAYATTSEKSVYSGPYKLSGWNGSSDTWTLKKNNQYWDKQNVKLASVKERVIKDPSTGLNLYNTNKLSEVALSGTIATQQTKNKDRVDRLSSNISRIDLNQNKVAAFKNADIRKAFSLTIDREALVNNVLKDGSKAALGFIPVGLGTNADTGKDFAKTTQVKSAVSYDLANAKKLYAKGAKAAGITSLNVNLLADDTDNSKAVAEYIQGALEQLSGVKVTITAIPKAQRLQKQNSGNYDMVVTAWQSVFADPYNFLDVWISNASYNRSGWKNAEFDQLLDESENKDGNNVAARWSALQKAEKILMNDQGTIPLYQANTLQLVKQNVKGINFNPSGVPYDFKGAYLK